jgi:hypothetical protein
MESDFCSRLVAALSARKISRNELVRLGYEGLSYRKVHAYCTGESAPPMEFLVMLGELGFDLPHLILGTPVPDSASGPAPSPQAAMLAQLAGAMQATRQALEQLAPLAAQAAASGLPPLTQAQLSEQERLIIEHLRTQPEKQAIVLAMLQPCPRCASQEKQTA